MSWDICYNVVGHTGFQGEKINHRTLPFRISNIVFTMVHMFGMLSVPTGKLETRKGNEIPLLFTDTHNQHVCQISLATRCT